MSRRKRSPEEQARREKIRELLQISEISSMEDIQNLFKETIAEFMENGLDSELDDELGYTKYDYLVEQFIGNNTGNTVGDFCIFICVSADISFVTENITD